MKKDRRTSFILTLLLIFIFAVFGGGSALGIIKLPFLSSSGTTSSSSEETSGHDLVESRTVSPSDIQIDQKSVSSEVNSDLVDSNETEAQYGLPPSTDKDKSFVVELTGGTGASSSSPAATPSAPAPGHDAGNSSNGSIPASANPGSSSGSTSENPSTSSGGTVVPGNRPKPSGGGDGGSHSIPIQSVTLDQSDVTINRKNTLQLTASIAPQNATNKVTVWTTSNKDVATVDSSGKVTGIGAGTTTITAAAGQKSASCEVTVVVLMDGIVLNHTELAIDKGSTEQLTAKIEPEDTTDDKAITWTSSDSDIASVDDSGKVTAHKVGKVDIKAAAIGATATCEITVLSPMTGIALDKSALTLNRNTTDKLTVSFLPDDTTSGREVAWSSSAPEVANVDQQGNVVAYGIGTATITATCGTFTAKCEVTVIALIEGIYLDQSEMTVDRGTNGQLIASIVPFDTTEDKTVTWSSSAPDVATVDETGKVTALKIGSTTITATAGTYIASCSVTVVALIHSISLDKSELTLDRSTGDQLTLTIDPPDTTEDMTVTWSSSDPDVATVDAAGNVTAVQTGSATITATVGTHTASSNINVVALIKSIALDQSALIVDRGTSNLLAVLYDPADTTEDKTVAWSSSDPTVATVDSSGNVTAIQIGSTTITAQVGTHTASCRVTVVALIHSITLDKTELTLDRGTGDQLTVNIDPPDTTEDKTVTWSSSDPDVATVDSSGKVTSVKIGTATITAKVDAHTASCSVTVVALIKNISLDKASITLSKDGAEQLTVSFDPVDTTESKVVTWTSSNTAVATVDSSGKVTATGAGKAVITAQVGTKTANCNVTVGVGYTISAGVTDYGSGFATLRSDGGCAFYVTPQPRDLPGGWATDYTWSITFDRPINITQGQSLIEYLGTRSGVGYSSKFAYPVAYNIKIGANAKFTGNDKFYLYDNFYSLNYSQDDREDYMTDGNIGLTIKTPTNRSGQIRSLTYTFTYFNRTSYFTDVWNSIKINGRTITGPTGYLDL